MILLKEINTTHEHYAFMENLLQTAFPIQERRDSEQQRQNTDDNPLFHNMLITKDDTPIGLLTYWDFNTFVYIEHFAIDSRLRNGGYGGRVLDRFRQQVASPIVLEAEEPSDELTRRRIGFYQRHGFVLQDFAYQQPPYRQGDEWFPMRLMCSGSMDLITARDTIYREVYARP